MLEGYLYGFICPLTKKGSETLFRACRNPAPNLHGLWGVDKVVFDVESALLYIEDFPSC